MYVSPQERPYETLASGLGGFGTGYGNDLEGGDPLAFSPADAVSRMLPPLSSLAMGPAGMLMGGISPILQSLGGILQQLAQALGGSNGSSGSNGYGGACPTPGGTSSPEQYFGSASGSSTGDPHLAFTGNGSSAHWDSMTGHGDLLDSDSFQGGFRLSTQTTTPNANGVTFNGSATASTHNGGTNVTLDNQGNATIGRNGRSYALQNGQSYDLGGGESVSRAADGSVDISERNDRGGSIETTLRDNGQGVDVNVRANNVDLGGDLANGAAGRGNPPGLPAPFPGGGFHPRPPHAAPPHHILEPVSAYDE